MGSLPLYFAFAPATEAVRRSEYLHSLANIHQLNFPKHLANAGEAECPGCQDSSDMAVNQRWRQAIFKHTSILTGSVLGLDRRG